MTQKNTPVAIIGAMEQEITLLQSRIAQPQHEKIAHVAITRGTLAGKPVLLAQSGIGKVNAAITTAILLEKYQAACVIIRALSDLADGEAEYSFETFLQMAATHSAEMVENLVKAL